MSIKERYSNMKNAIKDFVKAYEELAKKEQILNKFVGVRLGALIKKGDMDGMRDLVDELPRGYKGARRIYQAMYELDEKRN
jgi:hypothetical protein